MDRTRVLSALVFVAIGLVADPAGAVRPEATIPLELRAGEHVGAVALQDDASAWIAVAHMESRLSRLLHYRDEAPTQDFELGDLAVNRLEVIPGSARGETGPDTEASLFVGGAQRQGAEGRYVYRLLRAHGPMLETAWDSVLLPDSTDAIIRTDSGGELWGALHQRGDDELDLAVGPLPGYRATMTIHLESSWATGHIPRSVSADYPTFVFLGSDARSPVLAILWQNLVYVVGPGEDPVRAVIRVESPEAANLHWQPSRRTLWVWTSEGSLGYRIQSDIASRRPGQPIPVSDRISRIVGESRPTRIFSLTGGGVAVVVRTATGTRELRMAAFEGASPALGRELLSMPHGALVDLSPSGDVALLLPDGPRSDTAHLLRTPAASGR